MSTDIKYGGASTSTGIDEFGYSTVNTYCVLAGYNERLRFNGIVTKIKGVLISTNYSLKDVIISLWRDLVSSDMDCKNLIDSSTLVSNLPSQTFVELANPLKCNAGDAIGISWNSSDSSLYAKFRLTSGTSSLMRYQQTLKDSTSAWSNSSTSQICLEVYGKPATVFTYGDSISCGNSYWDATVGSSHYLGTRKNKDYDYSYLLKNSLNRILGSVVSGSGGTGSAYTSDGVANFATRVIPYVNEGCRLIANYGINDLVVTTMLVTDHASRWDSLLALAKAANVQLIRQEILYVAPGYPNSTTVNVKVNLWNDYMHSWCIKNKVPNIRINNYWQETWTSTGDFIHPNSTGYLEISKIIARELVQSLINERGGYLQFENWNQLVVSNQTELLKLNNKL